MMILATTTDESNEKLGQIDMDEFKKWRNLNLSVTEAAQANNAIASNARKMQLKPRTPIIDSKKPRQSKPKKP